MFLQSRWEIRLAGAMVALALSAGCADELESVRRDGAPVSDLGNDASSDAANDQVAVDGKQLLHVITRR